MSEITPQDPALAADQLEGRVGVVLSTGAQNGGQGAEVEVIWSAGSGPGPLRLFPRHEVRFEVQAGRLCLEVDGAERTLRAGEAATVPPGTRHRVHVPEGAPPARFLWRIRPALHDDELLAAALGAEPGTTPGALERQAEADQAPEFPRRTEMEMKTIESTIERLRESIAGDAYAAGEPGWDEARTAWNLAVDQRPAVVVLPQNAADIAEAVRWARGSGLQVVAQGTGHNPIPYGDLSGAMLIKTSRMREVSVDPEARTFRAEAGVVWGDVVPVAAQHGLMALHGSAHDVGVVGYALGGGVSWLARKYGLASESVTAIELVTADGRLVRATETEEPDLFWALRGGGGNFGIVTAVEMRLVQEPDVYAGILFFPLERAGEVLRAWRAWTETAPEMVTSIGRLLQLPDLELIPEPLRANSFAVVEATFLCPEEEAARLLAPLRELGPVMDTFAPVGPDGLLPLHMDPPEPVPAQGEGGMLASLSDEVIDAVVATIGAGTDSPLLTFEFRHLGGALARPGTGALGSLDGAYLTYGAGLAVGPEIVAAIKQRLAEVREVLRPVAGGRPYLNFTEEEADVATMFESDAYARLRAIKAKVDPDNLFRGNHAIA